MSFPAIPTNEEDQQARLQRMRMLATGLLLVMALLFVLARLGAGRYSWLLHVSAFAEAAMVGALADWFAVTALFRHPLGLPIPHTAIIPRNKDRIGSSVANFLEHNFMTREVLFDELKAIDFAGSCANWLAEPGHSRAVANEVVSGIPTLIRMVEDQDVFRLMHGMASKALQRVQLAPVLGEIAAVLIADQRHQQLFDRMLDMAAHALDNNREAIRLKIHEKSPAWLPRFVDEKLFEKLVREAAQLLDEMRAPDSPWRQQFQQAAQELVQGLKTDPAWEERIKHHLGATVNHPLFKSYGEELWQMLRQRLLQEGETPDSPLALRLEKALLALAAGLRQDPAVQDKLNNWLRAFAADAISARRHAIADLVRRVIEKWDADTIARKFELYVGRDLQYIRINGTVVGGLVGLGLHLVSLAL